MEKIIKIPTTEEKIFRQYLEIFNPIIKLRSKELDVLSQLLYFNDKLKDIPEEHRNKILFDYDTKKEMQNKIGLSGAYFDNCLSILRKKGIIINNKLIKNFLFYPDKDVKLTFNFVIK